MNTLSAREISGFQKIVWNYYKKHGRKLPWRFEKDPYKVLVSEVMLQQTQVSRVLQKYPSFIKQFPNVRALARAPLREVLLAWSGLGYNRRAKFLHETAKIIVEKYKGAVSRDTETLITLSGIGPGTAGAITAFAFNKPAVFIETNIRSVYIHHFFQRKKNISDKHILSLIAQTIDKTNSRQWYYALVDYGVMLKEKYKNPSRKSVHYTKQSPFKNSNRQVRGEILKLLTTRKSVSNEKIKKYITGNQKFIKNALTELQKENFIKIQNNNVRLVL